VGSRHESGAAWLLASQSARHHAGSGTSKGGNFRLISNNCGGEVSVGLDTMTASTVTAGRGHLTGRAVAARELPCAAAQAQLARFR
jgi:hypothetical protein